MTDDFSTVKIPFDSIVQGTEAEGAEIVGIEWNYDGELEIEYRKPD